MKYSETGFRAYYRHFVAVPLKKELQVLLEEFPGADQANCVLTYGYIDHIAGMTLEVIAAGIKHEDEFYFGDTNSKVTSKIQIGLIMDEECDYFEDQDGELYTRYSDKIDMLETYDVDEDIEESREMNFLDELRSPEYPDDVLVYLMKDGNQPEGCWVRIEGLGKHHIIGTLLNEPDQKFGYHEGEKVAFFAYQQEENKFILCSDMNPSAAITAEDLEDGSMLEAAIHAFHQEQTEENLLDILEILRDSYVWIPCTAVMSERDQLSFIKMLEEKGESIIGENLETEDETRLIPDVLQSGDSFLFPVFSTVDAMGEYGDDFSKMQQPFLEAISLAEHNKRDIEGIIVNAFTEPFALHKELWNVVKNMKSRIENN